MMKNSVVVKLEEPPLATHTPIDIDTSHNNACATPAPHMLYPYNTIVFPQQVELSIQHPNDQTK